MDLMEETRSNSYPVSPYNLEDARSRSGLPGKCYMLIGEITLRQETTRYTRSGTEAQKHQPL